MTVRVPAKINLELVVGPRRDDGYHDLSTVFHAVNLVDDVTVASADDWGVTVTGPYADLVPVGDDNLALRAARLLAARAPASPGATGEPGPVHIRIDKAIPVAGGMAGGSADAAATLLACDTLWRLRSEPTTLQALAAQLGSDVNFALAGGTAIGSGRGEKVVPVLARGRFHWVIALSDAGLSTPEVFAECDRLRAGRDIPAPQPTPAMMAALRSGDAWALGVAMSNDLQEAALSLRPDLGEVLAEGLRCGAIGGIVSGSGPTIGFLVDSAEGALDLAVALAATGVAADVRRAVGPAPGAQVLSGPSAVPGPAR